MAKLDTTSEVAITMSFIVMNLEKILAGILSFTLFLCRRLLSGVPQAALWGDDLACNPTAKPAKAA